MTHINEGFCYSLVFFKPFEVCKVGFSGKIDRLNLILSHQKYPARDSRCAGRLRFFFLFLLSMFVDL